MRAGTIIQVDDNGEERELVSVIDEVGGVVDRVIMVGVADLDEHIRQVTPALSLSLLYPRACARGRAHTRTNARTHTHTYPCMVSKASAGADTIAPEPPRPPAPHPPANHTHLPLHCEPRICRGRHNSPRNPSPRSRQ